MYPRIQELKKLVADKIVTKRPHPTLPIFIYNYSPRAASIPLKEWSTTLQEARGLILDKAGSVIARGFRKFWNYEQVADQIPHGDPFKVYEKLDGSLGIVASALGERIVATRGSFESDQALWAAKFMAEKYPNFVPPAGLTYLFEIIYPENRIVVDYQDREEMVLLSVLDAEGQDAEYWFNKAEFPKARVFNGIADFTTINTDPQFQGEEGFVVRWENGFRAKVKAEEYCRLHRLITQVSTRSIWELLRAGKSTSELVDRVPEEFKQWVEAQVNDLISYFSLILESANDTFQDRPIGASRKEFAEWANSRKYPHLLFRLLDGKPLEDEIWKMIEPEWSTPFRREDES